MSVDLLLSRLEGVQKSGNGWRSRCPACGGRSRKLSVSEADDGRTLAFCFGGCEALDVVQAAGLDLADLFPERLPAQTPDDRRRQRIAARQAQWGAALDVLPLEATIVLICAQRTAAGTPLEPDDLDRLATACERISDAQQILRNAVKWRPAPRLPVEVA